MIKTLILYLLIKVWLLSKLFLAGTKIYVVADSDYQLGSAAQTPGLNNSQTVVEYEVPTSQHITPLAEAYIARDRAYANQHVRKLQTIFNNFTPTTKTE